MTGTAASKARRSKADLTVSGWMLSPPARRGLLAIHITLACIWIGALMVTLLLIGARPGEPVAAWHVGVDRAVLLVHDTLIVNASYGFILTGLIFSLFTHWGAFRFWWLALKWGLLSVLGLLLPLWVGPHVSGMAALSDAMSGAVAGSVAYEAHRESVLLATSLQLVVLIGIVTLSVFKPWGPSKLKRRWPRAVSLCMATAVVAGLAAQLWQQEVRLEKFRRMPVAILDVSNLQDGRYNGRDIQGDFTFRVRVTVADGRVAAVDVLANRNTYYAGLATLAADKLVGRSQNDVDAISGATTTSKALLRAVSDALQNAPRKGIGQ